MLETFKETPKNVEYFWKLIREGDREAARIYLDSKGDNLYYTMYYVRREGKKISYTNERRTLGISINDRAYTKRSHLYKVTIDSKRGTFVHNGKVLTLSVDELATCLFEQTTEKPAKKLFVELVRTMYPRLYNIAEQFHKLKKENNTLLLPQLRLSVSYVLKSKATNLTDVVAERTKVSKHVAKMLLYEKHRNQRSSCFHHRERIKNLHLMYGVTYTDLGDLLRLAKLFRVKVDLKWSTRRMKEEHDKLSKRYEKVLLRCAEGEEALKISDIFLEFEKESGFSLMKHPVQLVAEGRKQHHCVGSYSGHVNDGRCAILHVNGVTVELGHRESSGIYIAQRQGPPDMPFEQIVENIKLLNKAVNAFNEKRQKNKGSGKWLLAGEALFPEAAMMGQAQLANPMARPGILEFLE